VYEAPVAPHDNGDAHTTVDHSGHVATKMAVVDESAPQGVALHRAAIRKMSSLLSLLAPRRSRPDQHALHGQVYSFKAYMPLSSRY
jgi:hypothetical protein